MLLTFSQFIQESKRLKDKITLSPHSQRFIDLWVSGESKALKVLTPEIKEELKNSLSQDSYRLMRTWKFTSQEELESFFGRPLERGKEVDISLPSPTSWTKAPKVSKTFANPRIDAFSKKYISDEDLEEMEYEEGDLLSISVTCFSLIPKDYLLADLDNIQGINQHLDEKEVIVDYGPLIVTVMKVQDWFFVKDKGDDSLEFVDLNPHNEDDEVEKERQRETELLEAKLAEIKEELKNKTAEDVLETLRTDVELIALAMNSGVKNPSLISKIREKSSKKTLKFFSLSAMLSMVERW